MSASIPSFSSHVAVQRLQKKHRSSLRCLQVRAQSFRDEGRSSNLVDSNMKVLKDRIEEVKMKERLERRCRREEYYHGWNHMDVPYQKPKKEEDLLKNIQMIGLIGGTFSLPILSGTAGLCLLSLLAHLNP